MILLLPVIFLCTGCGKKEATYFNPDTDPYIRESDRIDFDISTLNAIPDNPNPTLSVPTYITKVKDTYFIVDCYHNQVIYNENLTDPLYEWRIMASGLGMPHTLASDGFVYLIDDTENNRVLVMEEGVNETDSLFFSQHRNLQKSGTDLIILFMTKKQKPFTSGAQKAVKCTCFADRPMIPVFI